MFSDESRFQLCPDDHRRRIWRHPGLSSDPAFTFAHRTALNQELWIIGTNFKGISKGHYKDSDLHSNPCSETFLFRCSFKETDAHSAVIVRRGVCGTFSKHRAGRYAPDLRISEGNA
ncbi:hypothetical protein TNCV_470981 [Trichonephila clavipes]|nr:hypothetical protein TNCV_470981 [Trichonephila clavipes]